MMKRRIVAAVIVLAIAGVLVPFPDEYGDPMSLAVRGWRKLNARPHLDACKSNLMNLGTALEMYSTDSSGRFPPDLSRLVPKYLKSIPICPSGQRDTYSAGYEAASNPDAYTVSCQGANHTAAGFAPGLPQHTSTYSILER